MISGPILYLFLTLPPWPWPHHLLPLMFHYTLNSLPSLLAWPSPSISTLPGEMPVSQSMWHGPSCLFWCLRSFLGLTQPHFIGRSPTVSPHSLSLHSSRITCRPMDIPVLFHVSVLVLNKPLFDACHICLARNTSTYPENTVLMVSLPSANMGSYFCFSNYMELCTHLS